MTAYIPKYDVAILDEHTVQMPPDDSGHSKTVTVDADELRRIAARGNRRIRDTGDYCPVVIGHTKDGVKESDQPEIVGYASNFKVKRLGRTARMAIHATFHFLKSKYHKTRNYPRRSVELWPTRHEIDPISLLGATSPERDLGLLKYSKPRDGTEPSLHYSRSLTTLRYAKMPMPPQDPKTKDPKGPKAPKLDADAGCDPADAADGAKSESDKIATKVFQMLQESDVFQWAKAQMEQGDQGDQGLPPDDGAAPGGHDDFDLGLGDDLEGDGAAPGAPKGPGPVQMEGGAAPAAPSGSNGAPPEELQRMSRHREELVQYQRDFEDLSRSHVDLQLKFQRSEREKDLIQLEGEGITLDRIEELDYVASLPDAQYQRHLATIRKRYQRAPVVGPRWTGHTTMPVQYGRGGSRTKEQVAAITATALEKRISYEDACKALDGERVL